MNVNTVVMVLVTVFICIACADKLIGSRLGFGALIDEGFYTLGAMAMIMIGMITMSPVIARILCPIIVPALRMIKADPSLFIAAILSSDCGGASISLEICHVREAGLFNGIVVASMIGASLGVIPIVLSATDREKHRYVILGLLIGFMTVPAAALISGWVAGLDKNILFYNLLPVIVLSLVIAAALVYAQSYAVRVMIYLGQLIFSIAVLGFFASAAHLLTGIEIISGMAPIESAFIILGQIGIVLTGILPMLHLIKKIFHRQLMRLSLTMQLDSLSLIGIITTLANFLPVIPLMNKMTDRGVVINMAFAVPAAYAIGDHLGFTAGFERSFVFPLLIGKLSGGIMAIIASSVYCRYIGLK